MFRLLASVGKGGKEMVRPEKNLARMSMERNQLVYYRFTLSYQSFLLKQITILCGKEMYVGGPSSGWMKKGSQPPLLPQMPLFPVLVSETRLGLRNLIDCDSGVNLFEY